MNSTTKTVSLMMLYYGSILIACTTGAIGSLSAVLIIALHFIIGVTALGCFIFIQMSDNFKADIIKSELKKNESALIRTYELKKVLLRYGTILMTLLVLIYFGAFITANAIIFSAVTTFLLIDYAFDFGRDFTRAKEAKQKRTPEEIEKDEKDEFFKDIAEDMFK